MSAPTIPLAVLVEVSEVLAIVEAMGDGQPLSYAVWNKVMTAHTRLSRELVGLQPVAIGGATP